MLSLDQANAIVSGALEKASSLGLNPLSVTVLDARGAVKAAAAQDGTALNRSDIAYGKALGAIGLGVSSRKLEAMAKDRPHFMESAIAALKGHVVPVPGGVLIADGSGSVIGAVGISGDTSDNDEAACVAGIEKAGLKAVI